VGLSLVGQQLQVFVLHVLANLVEVERDVAVMIEAGEYSN
jgi:hypothetical protein